jgi:DNA-directed RNA polymerase specialized sigma24 family protein
MMTPFTTPKDLVNALRQRTPKARRQLEDMFCKLVGNLIDRVVRRLNLPDDPRRSIDAMLRSIEMHLVSQAPHVFNGASETFFQAFVLWYCRRVLVEPASHKRGVSGKATTGSKALSQKPLGEQSEGAFKIRWFVQQLDRVGGDRWDHQRLDNGRQLVFVTDVTGHSLPAHVIAEGVSDLWKMCVDGRSGKDLHLPELFKAMNDELHEVLPEDVFIEATLAQVDSRLGSGTVCGAGYLMAAVKASTIDPFLVGGPYLGVQPQQTSAWDEKTLEFPRSAELLMATDGLWDQFIDAEKNRRFRQGIALAVERVGEIKSFFEAVHTSWQNARRDVGQHDDVCMVTVQNFAKAERTTADAELAEPASPDHELVWRVLHGDRKASDEFGERFKARVWSLVHQFIPDPQKKEDAFQEVWFRIMVKVPSWKGGSLLAWVTRVATNRLIDLTRGPKPPKGVSLDAMQKSGYEPPDDHVPGDNDPLERVLRVSVAVEKKLAGLPKREQSFLLMLLQGWPDGFIQEALGIKPQNYRALKDRLWKHFLEAGRNVN